MGHINDWMTMGDERRAEAKAPAFTHVAHSCQPLRCTHADTSIPAPSRGRGQGQSARLPRNQFI